MDLVTGQRTFYIGVSGISDEEIVEVPFVDSAGSGMSCNYFKITARGRTISNQGAIVAELSGVSHVGDRVTNDISALEGTPSPSGICGIGFVFGVDSQYHEWHGSNGQVCTGIKLRTTIEAGDVIVGITYGNLFPLNTIRTTNDLIYDAGA